MPNETDWNAIGQAFENIGMELRTGCENMATNCSVDDEFMQLYVNYVQLLESIKVQRRVIQNRFNEIC